MTRTVTQYDLEMTAEELAWEIKRRFGERKPSEIASQNNLQVEFNEWFPATYGEFYADEKRIVVNRRAPFDDERIIAHELGHFFVREYKIGKIADEEIFCECFAEKFLKTDEND